MSVPHRAPAVAALLALPGPTLAAVALPVPAWAGSDDLVGWLHDPVSAAEHRAEIAVPADPRGYHRPTRWTRAHYRTQSGRLAVPAGWAAGQCWDRVRQ